MRYRYNRYCPCARCRAHGFMGPAILIVIGVLFLLDQMGRVYWLGFDYTWPALLIVIGLVLLLEHSASLSGHVPREFNRVRDDRYGVPPYPGQPMPPGPQAYTGYPPQPPVSTPPPNAPAGFIQPGLQPKPGDQEERNG